MAGFALSALLATGAGIDLPEVDGAAANTSGEASGAAGAEFDAASSAETGLGPTGALLSWVVAVTGTGCCTFGAGGGDVSAADRGAG